MNRRHFLKLATLAGCGSLSACMPQTTRMIAETDRPNIVLFISDDHGWADSGAYGDAYINTHNIDRLANESMRFTNAFAASPLCSPSRCVIETGLMPHRNGGHKFGTPIKPNIKTMPEYLKPWEDLLRDHVAEHRSMFERVSLDLGGSDRDTIATDERLARVKKGEAAPALAALYFQYGRYLLMSSSRRPGRLPANLQGIWNEAMWAPWEADYHLNINLQMNYWPADAANLSETLRPLADWFVRLTEKGRVSARRLYDADGWVTFTSTNPFGRTTPSGSTEASQFQNGVLDPLAGAWMAMTLWRHYEFTQDKAFLLERAYPVLKGAAEFILDYLVEDQDGYLVVVPSTSPENTYIHPELNKPVRIARGSRGGRFRESQKNRIEIQTHDIFQRISHT